MMEAVIFAGIQGSGKSTFYEERFVDTRWGRRGAGSMPLEAGFLICCSLGLNFPDTVCCASPIHNDIRRERRSRGVRPP